MNIPPRADHVLKQKKEAADVKDLLNRIVALSTILLSSSLPAAYAQKSTPPSQLQNQPSATPITDILLQNPIKLSITQNAPSSDLPEYTGPFSMDRAVQVGLEHNLEYGQAQIDTKISHFNTRAALALFGPNISANTFYSASSLNQMLFFPAGGVGFQAPMQPIVKGSSFSLIFAGVQPLFTGGLLLGQYKATKALEKQSIAKYGEAKIDTARSIKQLYLQAAWYQARLRVDNDYVKLKTWSASNMKQRVDEGKAPTADYLREEAEVASAKAQLNQDYKDFNLSLINLKTNMGINLSSLIDVADPLEFVDTSGDLSTFLLKAGTSRPEIAQAQSRVDEMRAKRMMARSKYLPHVDLYGLGSNITGSSPDGNADGRFGGFVSVIGHYTIFDSGQRAAELHAASQAIKQVELARQQAQLKVAQDVSSAWVELDLTRRNVELAKAQVVSTEEDYRLIHTRYEIGKSIALEVFDASVKLFRARLAFLEAVYNYRLAQTNLVWSSGSI